MVAGKPLHHHGGKLGLPVEVDVFVGDEHVVKDHQQLHPAVLGVAHVDVGVLQLPGVAALAADDHEQSLGVGGGGEGDGVVLVIGPHGLGGHHQDLVGIAHARLMGFGPPDHDAVGTPLHHVEEHVRVLLLVGGQGPVALGVGHGAVNGPVLGLGLGHKLAEVFVVAGAVLLVNFVRGAVHGVDGVHPHAALETCRSDLTQQALHLDLVDQVLGGLVDVGEPVDGLSGEMGGGGHQRLIIGTLGQIIGHPNGVDRGAEDGIVHGVFHPLAEHVDPQIHGPQALNVFFSGHHCHSNSSFPCFEMWFS